VKHLTWHHIVVAIAFTLATGDFLIVHAQQQTVPTPLQKLPLRPRQPGGYLNATLGTYLTIEGVLYDGKGKVESNSLMVDTVNGKKLDKPLLMLVQNVRLPAKTRCVLAGYEDGAMIGIPPAVQLAFKQQGRKDVPMSPTPYQWRPYFVPLIAIEPQGLEITTHWVITKR